MTNDLAGRRVAILVADGFEQAEMTGPRRALEEAGARACIVSLTSGHVTGWAYDRPGDAFPVDVAIEEADVKDFDALLLPGGVLNPDALRESGAAVRFIREFMRVGKPVAAICLGVQAMIEAGVMRDRTVTSFPAVRAELLEAGANWVDASVVVDHGLVTSRSPEDLEEFKARMIEEFGGERQGQAAPAGG